MRKHAGLIASVVVIGTYVTLVPFHTQDGANHRQVAVTLERLASSPREAAVYGAQLGPLQTNSLFPRIYGFVAPVISVRTYERLFLGVGLVALLIAYRWFLGEWAAGKARWWPWALPVSIHPLVVTGMYNFLASMVLTLVGLVTMRRALSADRSRWWLGLFAVTAYVAFLAHPFPFFILAAALGAGLATGEHGRDRFRFVGVAAVVAGFLFVGFLWPLLGSESGPDIPYRFLPPVELAAGLLYYNFVGFSIVHLALAVPLLGAAAALAVHALRHGGRANLLWLACLMGYVLFPSEGDGGAHINERFLPFVWFFLPVAASVTEPWRRRLAWGVCGTTAALAVALAAGMWRIDGAVAEARAVLAEMPDGARLYGVNFDPKGPALTYSPLTHLWAQYDERRVAFAPQLFAFSRLMPLRRRRPATPTYFPSTAENLPEALADGRLCRPSDPMDVIDCDAIRDAAYDRVLDAAGRYDYWFVYRPPAPFAARLAARDGLELVGRRGDASLWRNVAALPFDPPLEK